MGTGLSEINNFNNSTHTYKVRIVHIKKKQSKHVKDFFTQLPNLSLFGLKMATYLQYRSILPNCH